MMEFRIGQLHGTNTVSSQDDRWILHQSSTKDVVALEEDCRRTAVQRSPSKRTFVCPRASCLTFVAGWLSIRCMRYQSHKIATVSRILQRREHARNTSKEMPRDHSASEPGSSCMHMHAIGGHVHFRGTFELACLHQWQCDIV